MDINLIFQIAAVGILIAVINQILIKAGRDEQAMLVTLAGLVIVLYWVVENIYTLFVSIQNLFNL